METVIRHLEASDEFMTKNFINYMYVEYKELVESGMNIGDFRIPGINTECKIENYWETWFQSKVFRDAEKYFGEDIWVCTTKDKGKEEIIGLMCLKNNLVFGDRITGSNIMISVVPEYRRFGIGTKLAAFGIERITKNGKSSVQVVIEEINLQGKCFAESLGIVPSDRLELTEGNFLKLTKILDYTKYEAELSRASSYKTNVVGCKYCRNVNTPASKIGLGEVIFIDNAKYTFVGDGKSYNIPTNHCPNCGRKLK